MVSAWNEKVSIPTYATNKPEKYPMFFENRVYQGSSGAVYPYPVIESVSDICTDKEYNAVYLENEYLRVMILPELGGRVQMIWDKIKNRHVVYYNSVIKPALVGLTGPWISGGIEFNWPQHHRPGTFQPLDFWIQHNDDGSCTVWVTETERMTYQKSRAGFTLHPGKAFLEVNVRLYNGTPFAQTFLWWANPAVAVNDHYQSVFPPDVHAVFDHGKRDVSTFPIATGSYYKIDYSEGVDISMYKNIPVPTSYMAVNSKYDFVGGYEHDQQVGMIHLANHRISPGKKLWTWGNSDFGKAWNKHLTDQDGAYMELMAGVFTDNQPDFSWLKPYEEKAFSQYFIPYHDLGLIKNASTEVLLNLESAGGFVTVKVQSTSQMQGVRVKLPGFLDEVCELTPEEVFVRRIALGDADPYALELSIYNADGALILKYNPERKEDKQPPLPASAARKPGVITSSDELSFTGLHLEQYRHASLNPVLYYQRAVSLDPDDFRSNQAMGMWLLKRYRFSEAEQYLRKAVSSVTRYNPNPPSGEVFYNLGLSLRYQNRCDDAYDAFYKASWSADIQDAAWFQCAELSSLSGKYANALSEVEKSLARNSNNRNAQALKLMLLRRTGNASAAVRLAELMTRTGDPDILPAYEVYLLTGSRNAMDALMNMEGFQQINVELAAYDYMAAGFFREAIGVLESGLAAGYETTMVWYTLAWLQQHEGNDPHFYLQKASAANPDYCFPNRIESLQVLEAAIQINAPDYKAHYYLGNLWYDKRQYEKAIGHWEKAVALNDRFAEALRNLAIASFNKLHQSDRALSLMQMAFGADYGSARLLVELDQLMKIMKYNPSERLKQLRNHFPLVKQRDDLYLELVTLYNLRGQYEVAAELLGLRRFHPWEGGEGKVIHQYKMSRLGKAVAFLADQQIHAAIKELNHSLRIPENLGEAKLPLPQDQEVYYLLGTCYQMLKNEKMAVSCFKNAVLGDHSLNEVLYYNDLQPDRILYQAAAFSKLGEAEMAKQLIMSLVNYSDTASSEEEDSDYFAVSVPDMLIWDHNHSLNRSVHRLYLNGLGQLGAGNQEAAEALLQSVINSDPGHQGAAFHLKLTGLSLFGH